MQSDKLCMDTSLKSTSGKTKKKLDRQYQGLFSLEMHTPLISTLQDLIRQKPIERNLSCHSVAGFHLGRHATNAISQLSRYRRYRLTDQRIPYYAQSCAAFVTHYTAISRSVHDRAYWYFDVSRCCIWALSDRKRITSVQQPLTIFQWC